MYINDIHIAYYAIAIIASIVIGQLVDWANKRMPEYKKILSKDIINEYKIEFKPNYILILVIAIIYVTLLYNYGIKPTLIANLDLIKYLIISPMLVSAFVIDYKHQIIPNRLNLTLFEIGIIFAFLDKFNFGEFIFRVSTQAEAQINSVSIYMTTGQYIINIITTIVLTLSVIATIFSGINYLKDGKDLFKD